MKNLTLFARTVDIGTTNKIRKVAVTIFAFVLLLTNIGNMRSQPCTTPASQPFSLALSPSFTSVSGSFNAAVSNPDGYLVVITTSAASPTNPVDGTTYSAGQIALGGTIVQSGGTTSFYTIGLSVNTQYWFWGYSMNEFCTGGPNYNTISPLTNNTTTLDAKIWNGAGVSGGTGSSNFNLASNWTGGLPGNSDNALVNTTLAATVSLSANITLGNLIINHTPSSAFILRLDASNKILIINGTFNSYVSGPNAGAQFQMNVGAAPGAIIYNGNATYSSDGVATNFCIFGSGGTTGSVTYKANASFGPGVVSSTTTNLPATVTFDGTGTQTIDDNAGVNVIYFGSTTTNIGSANNPIVFITGNASNCRVLGNLNINGSSVLDLGTSTFNRNTTGGTMTLNGTSALLLGGSTGGQTGSNFPLLFTTKTLSSGSKVEYYGTAQTIYNAVTYAYLTLSGTGVKTAGGALTVTRDLTIISGAAFSAGSFTHNIAGNWINSGTFTAAASTINFNGTSLVSGSSTNSFKNLTIAAASALTGPASSTINVSGNWVNNGVFNHNNGTARFNGTSVITGSSVNTFNNVTIIGTLTGPASANMNVEGNWSKNGTYTNNGGTITFSGVTSQNIAGTTNSVFNNLTLSNASGLNIATSPSVTGTLTFVNGKITTGINNIALGSSATCVGAAAGKYIFGNEVINIPNTSAPSRTFDIGDATVYAPVNLDFTGTVSGSGNITACTNFGTDPNENIPTANASGIDQAHRVNRYYTLTNTNVAGFTSANVTFNYAASDVMAGSNPSTFQVRKYDATIGWSATTAGIRTGISSQAVGITGFGDFEIGNISLPAVAITCPSNINVTTDAGVCSADVNFTGANAATSTGLPAGVITYSPLSGSSFALGTTLVTATATNINGTASCTFNVIVTDAIVPVITAPADITTCNGNNISIGTPVTSDNCSVASVTNDHPSTTYAAGTTTVTWTVTDCAGNTATALQNILIGGAGPIGSANNIVICNGAPANLMLNSTVTGTTFTWTSSVVSGTATGNGTCSSNCGTTVTDVLINTGVIHGVVEYTIIPTSPGGCIGTTFTAQVTIGAAPAMPVITGLSVVCEVNTATYSVAPVAEATSYIWTVPTNGPNGMTIISGQGTNTITVAISAGTVYGDITCIASNNCGNSPIATMAVSKKPPVPGAISGPVDICGITSTTYSIDAVFGATSYTWTIPAGMTLVSGAGTTSVLVNVSSSFTLGVVRVMAVNNCGSIPGASLAVYGKTSPNVLTGPSNVCGMTTATYTCNSVFNALSYAWTVPASWTITGQGTTTIVATMPANVNNAMFSGIVRVHAVSNCGISADKVMMVNYCKSETAMLNTTEDVQFSFSSVYPNPATSEFTVDITSMIENEVTVQVYDVLGNLVVNKKHQIVNGTNTMKTNIENFENGIYFVRLLDVDSNVINTQRVIKQ